VAVVEVAPVTLVAVAAVNTFRSTTLPFRQGQTSVFKSVEEDLVQRVTQISKALRVKPPTSKSAQTDLQPWAAELVPITSRPEMEVLAAALVGGLHLAQG
jgi:hypothetical protein